MQNHFVHYQVVIFVTRKGTHPLIVGRSKTTRRQTIKASQPIKFLILNQIFETTLSVDNTSARTHEDRMLPYLIDSGCSYSYTGDLSDLHNIKPSSGTVIVSLQTVSKLMLKKKAHFSFLLVQRMFQFVFFTFLISSVYFLFLSYSHSEFKWIFLEIVQFADFPFTQMFLKFHVFEVYTYFIFLQYL